MDGPNLVETAEFLQFSPTDIPAVREISVAEWTFISVFLKYCCSPVQVNAGLDIDSGLF